MRLTLEDDFRDVFRMFFNKLRRLIRSRQNENRRWQSVSRDSMDLNRNSMKLKTGAPRTLIESVIHESNEVDRR